MTARPTLDQRGGVAWLLGQARRRDVALLLATMAAISLTEGLGIVALVPVLASLDSGGGVWLRRIEALTGATPTAPMLLGVLVAIAGLRAALQYSRGLKQTQIEHETIDGLRARAFGAILHAEWRWLAQRRASDHASLIITNVGRVGQGLNQLLASGGLAVAAAGYMAAALLLSWQVAAATVALGGVVLGAFAAHRRRALAFGHQLTRAGKALHGFVHEGLDGVRIIKAYGTEGAQAEGFAAAMRDVRVQHLRNSRMNAAGGAWLQFGGAAVLAMVVAIGHLWLGVALATLLPLLLVFARLAPMLSALQASWSVWVYTQPAIADLRALLAAAEAVREPPAPPAVPLRVRDAIALRDVAVRYAGRDRPALAGVSLCLTANTTTALCGESGAGKSTLADVVMGLIEPDAGQLLVDGVPTVGADRIAWRRSVAYVQQDAFLFHASIHANVAMGRDVSRDELHEALRRAGADFVHGLPDGLETVVGDGGARVSGGERQRIALARALVGAPTLVILDEATSALDPATEQEVRQTLRALRGQVTLLFITHRTMLHEDADQVVTLERGAIVGSASGPVEPSGVGRRDGGERRCG